MSTKPPVDLVIFVVMLESNLGTLRPIKFGIPPDANLSPYTHPSFDRVLGYGGTAKSKARYFYCIRLKQFLDPNRSLAQQRVVSGDALLYLDQADLPTAQSIAEAAIAASGIRLPPASSARWLRALRALIEGIPYVGKAIAELIFPPK